MGRQTGNSRERGSDMAQVRTISSCKRFTLQL